MKTTEQISPEQQLLLLLTYVSPGEHESEKAIRLAHHIRSWTEFYELAKKNNIIPLISINLKKLDLVPLVPADLWELMCRESEKIRTTNIDRIEESKIFLSRFEKAGIEVVLLKGICFAEVIYKDAAYKRMNDIDILVRREAIPEIYSIYDELEYFYIGERIGGSKEKSDKLSHLSPPYVSRNFKCVIGTQWGLKTPLGPYKLNYPEIWSRVVPFNFYGLNLKMLSPEDNLHHLCLHLGYFKTAVRDLMDIYNLIRHYGTSFNWKVFAETVKNSRSENKVYHALLLSNRLCPLPEVEVYLDTIKTLVSGAYTRGAAERISSIDFLLNSYSDHIQELEKAITEFNMAGNFNEKWELFFSLWGLIIYPPAGEMEKLVPQKGNNKLQKIRTRLTIPFRIIWVIAGEVGWPVTFLLMIKTVVDVLKTTLTAPFNQKKTGSAEEEYAKQNGLDPQKLKELKAQFQ